MKLHLPHHTIDIGRWDFTWLPHCVDRLNATKTLRRTRWVVWLGVIICVGTYGS